MADTLNCSNCSSDGTYCLSCEEPFVYFNDSECLEIVPSGYVNISGEAVPCSENCQECIVTEDTCTLCNLTAGLYLFEEACYQ